MYRRAGNWQENTACITQKTIVSAPLLYPGASLSAFRAEKSGRLSVYQTGVAAQGIAWRMRVQPCNGCDDNGSNEYRKQVFSRHCHGG